MERHKNSNLVVDDEKTVQDRQKRESKEIFQEGKHIEFTASSIMRSKLVICDSTSSLREVARKTIDEDVGSVLIKQEKDIVGIITVKGLLRAALKNKDFKETPAGEIMSSPLGCCHAEDSLERCMELFEKTNYTRLAVKEEGKVVGVLLRKFVERFLNVSKRYSLANIAHTPRFRTGR